MRLPLDDIRVLDLSSVIAGPYCSYHLVQMGATVIKIEQPGSGDAARRQGADPALNARNMGASFLGLNAGKRAITLNLKHPDGKAIFLRLLATADVVLENFRPGVMERLGLGYEALRAERPGLVYCAISGFGQDTSYRAKPAYDQIVQGLSGAMATTGDAGSGPLRAGYPVSDTLGGINAAYAIVAALLQRERDPAGTGQFIDVSMLDATISAMGWATSNWLAAGQKPRLMGNDNFSASPSGSFRVADGLINVAANMQPQFEAFCRIVGREALIADPRFPDPDARIQHRDALKAELESALQERPGAEWVEALNAAGVPAGPVLGLDEATRLPPVQERGSVQRFEGVPGVERPFEVFRPAYRLSGGAPQTGEPPAQLGQHTDAVLAELGYSAEEIAAFREAGAV
ncbi:MAG TPA: CoA transferase [bacterium]|nr:CoA transferase [bacterium]